MTEEERAGFYEQHKDDPDVWEDVTDAPAAPRRGGLSATMTVRFPPDEAASIRDFARRYDMSYSDVVRNAVRNYLQPRFSYEASRIDFRLYGAAPVVVREDRVEFGTSTTPTSTGGARGRRS